MIEINLSYIQKPKSERQSHLDLSEPCICRGADSIQCRGLLAYYLDTTVPKTTKVVLAHACHNGDCNNPKHLYWASRSENEQDKYASPDGERIKALQRANSKGENNINYGKKPWCVQNAHISSWEQAQYLYENYFSKGWNYGKYGQGLTYFINKYNIVAGSGKTMLKMFRSGWIPKDDPDWINYFKTK